MMISLQFVVHARGSVYWKLPLIPLKVRWNSSSFSIEGSSEVTTPLGTFGIAEGYELGSGRDRGKVDTIIRNGREVRVIYTERDDFMLVIRARGKDHIYLVKGFEEIAVISNDRTVTNVTNKKVVVDLISGKVEDISFRGNRYMLRCLN